jgi:hypothetical protein
MHLEDGSPSSSGADNLLSSSDPPENVRDDDCDEENNENDISLDENQIKQAANLPNETKQM